MQWNVGITYPQTAVNTPFGVIWVDQSKRIRLWNQQGFPSEIGEPLRAELDAITFSISARWFQHGKNGGYYVISDGVKMLFVMIYLSASGQMELGYGKSTSLFGGPMATATFSNNAERFFFAQNLQLFEILDPTLEGDGWSSDTELFFKMVVGNSNKNMNFSSLHSMQLSGDLGDLVITHAPMDETNPEEVVFAEDLEMDTGDSSYALIDSVERRYHVLDFEWGLDDTDHRGIDSMTINVKNAGRVI
jgi:hypothetical protein